MTITIPNFSSKESVGILIAKGKNAAIKKAFESPLMQRKET